MRPHISTLSSVGGVHSLEPDEGGSEDDTIGILDTSTTSYGIRSRKSCRSMLSGLSGVWLGRDSRLGIGRTTTLCTSAADNRSRDTSSGGSSSVSDRWAFA